MEVTVNYESLGKQNTREKKLFKSNAGKFSK